MISKSFGYPPFPVLAFALRKLLCRTITDGTDPAANLSLTSKFFASDASARCLPRIGQANNALHAWHRPAPNQIAHTRDESPLSVCFDYWRIAQSDPLGPRLKTQPLSHVGIALQEFRRVSEEKQ